MADKTNIPTGLNITTQIPLDVKKFIQNESLLSNLGQDNNLAFTYYDGIVVKCIDQNTFYEWREVLSGEENTGLLSVDFTYPYNHSAFGINYSNKSFNFFQTNLDIIIPEYDCDNIGKSPTPLSEGHLYKEKILNGDVNEFTFRTIYNNDGTIELTEEIGSVRINSKTFINQGSNITITGSGTTSNPFVINSTVTGTTTLLEDSTTTTVSGDGTLGNEYQVDVNNLQKVVNTFPYTLLNSDDKYTIFVDNGASNVIINVPDILVDNFSVAFVQKGTGDVTVTPTGTSVINTAVGYKIKGQYYWALLEKELNTVTYYLIGNTKL